jgi:predicted RNA-binding Zn-ribbon protein involved in translation (DUF1610 family)
MPKLVVLQGPKTSAEFQLDGERCTLGRDETCDISLADSKSSRNHALIVKRGDSFYLRDLSSRNGTFHNGKKLTDEVELALGDMVTVGHTLLQLVSETASPSVSASPPAPAAVRMRCPNCGAHVRGQMEQFAQPARCPRCGAQGIFMAAEGHARGDTSDFPPVAPQAEAPVVLPQGDAQHWNEGGTRGPEATDRNTPTAARAPEPTAATQAMEAIPDGRKMAVVGAVIVVALGVICFFVQRAEWKGIKAAHKMYERGEKKEAVEIYRKVIDDRSISSLSSAEEITAYARLTDYEAEFGNKDVARKLIEQALEHKPPGFSLTSEAGRALLAEVERQSREAER